MVVENIIVIVVIRVFVIVINNIVIIRIKCIITIDIIVMETGKGIICIVVGMYVVLIVIVINFNNKHIVNNNILRLFITTIHNIYTVSCTCIICIFKTENVMFKFIIIVIVCFSLLLLLLLL